MSDDYEERTREDWFYTYKAWDAAHDRRRAEREHEITRLGVEGARLGREIGRSERARELQEWIDRFLLNKKHELAHIEGLDASVVRVSAKTEWRQQLDRIDPRAPQAKLELEDLLRKVRTFKVAWIEAEKIRIAIESRHLESRLWDPTREEQRRRGEKVRRDYLESVVELIESSLKVLVSICEVISSLVRS